MRIADGKTATTLYPSNKKLMEEGKRMLPPPEYVYRRINFPDGIPAEYEWAGVISEEHRARGGSGLQRMTIDTWLVIGREKLRPWYEIGRRISLGWAACSEALASAADAAAYVLIGFSIAFFLIVTHSEFAVASQEGRHWRHATIG